jgi:hypothetical protein
LSRRRAMRVRYENAAHMGLSSAIILHTVIGYRVAM